MSSKSKKVLVTGVAGFLGSHLSEKLGSMGHKVVGIDNMIGGYEDNVPSNVEFHKIDCCDFNKVKSIMKGIDVFIIVQQQLMRDFQFFHRLKLQKQLFSLSFNFFCSGK